jgi:hypothetical protein
MTSSSFLTAATFLDSYFTFLLVWLTGAGLLHFGVWIAIGLLDFGVSIGINLLDLGV